MQQTPQLLNKMVKSRLVDDELQFPWPVFHRTGWCRDFVALPDAVIDDMFDSKKDAKPLHLLLKEMDLDHPDLEGCLSEKIFFDHTRISFIALVKLAGLAVLHGHADWLGSLSQLDLLPKILSDTASTKSLIRCMRDPARRDELRRLKKPQVIDMATVARKGEELWNTQPSSFDLLIRHEKAYAEEIAAATKRAARFASLGCTTMHSEIIKTVETFQSQVADSYLGFNRLTFNSACVILAKWHGYQLTTPHILSDFPNERNYKVSVDPSRFRKLKWDFFAKPEDAEIAWPYSPRVYPLNELEPLTPDVQEIVGLCESYQGYGGKPLFDHYAVMVPGIDYPLYREGQYAFRDENGVLASFDDQNEARFALDKALLAANAFSAVVMGERDGKCYCLSVWS